MGRTWQKAEYTALLSREELVILAGSIYPRRHPNQRGGRRRNTWYFGTVATVLALLTLAFVGSGTGAAVAAGSSQTNLDPAKAAICKYVGTPRVDERLQSGNNPIVVDRKADMVAGSYFNDAQGRSYVIGFLNPGDPEPDVSQCPPPPPANQCADGSNPGDANGDGTADAKDCNYTPPPAQCQDGSNPGDLNGDGTADAQDCGYVPPPVDVCPNIAGNQPTIPTGMVKNNAGDCVTPPPANQCQDGSNPGDLNGDGTADAQDCGYVPPVEPPVTLCHATGSLSNPYVKITVSPDGAYNGHYGSAHQNGGDIIPPFQYQGHTYSENWDTAGQAVFNDNCAVLAPPAQCQDGSNPGDLNGDGTADAKDCNYTPPPTDACPHLPGTQPTGTDCTPPPVDVCDNLPGNQPAGTDCMPPVIPTPPVVTPVPPTPPVVPPEIPVVVPTPHQAPPTTLPPTVVTPTTVTTAPPAINTPTTADTGYTRSSSSSSVLPMGAMAALLLLGMGILIQRGGRRRGVKS